MNHEFSETEFTLEGQALMDASLLDQLEKINKLYVAHLSSPSETNSQLLTDVLNNHLDTVKFVFEKIDDCTNSQENINEMIAYARGLEINRVTTLNVLHMPKDADEDDYYEVAEEEFEALRDYLTSDDRDIENDISNAGHMYNFYAISLQRDARYFASKNVSDYHKRPDVIRKEKFKKFGLRAIDIAISSATAYVVVSYLNKFKKK